MCGVMVITNNHSGEKPLFCSVFVHKYFIFLHNTIAYSKKQNHSINYFLSGLFSIKDDKQVLKNDHQTVII